jgi:hypothetical protein
MLKIQEMMLVKNVISFFGVFFVSTAIAEELKNNSNSETLKERYNVIKKSLIKEDFSDKEGIVSGIRCYYNLCGVDQMVTIYISKSNVDSDSLLYSIDVASANIPGAVNPSVIVNQRVVDGEKLKNLFETIDKSRIFEKLEVIEEVDKMGGQLIFAEQWSKDGKKNSIVVRDFYESRDLDILMLQMYQLAWNPSLW